MVSTVIIVIIIGMCVLGLAAIISEFALGAIKYKSDIALKTATLALSREGIKVTVYQMQPPRNYMINAPHFDECKAESLDDWALRKKLEMVYKDAYLAGYEDCKRNVISMLTEFKQEV